MSYLKTGFSTGIIWKSQSDENRHQKMVHVVSGHFCRLGQITLYTIFFWGLINKKKNGQLRKVEALFHSDISFGARMYTIKREFHLDWFCLSISLIIQDLCTWYIPGSNATRSTIAYMWSWCNILYTFQSEKKIDLYTPHVIHKDLNITVIGQVEDALQ